MSATALRPATPAEHGRAGLLAEIERVRALLSGERLGDRAATPCPTLDDLAARLDLSGFERDVVMMLVAVQLDGGVAQLVEERGGASFALAQAVLPDPHWDAVLPDRPLRRWRLLELGPGTTLAARRLQLDEHVLHVVTGLSGGARLGGLVAPRVGSGATGLTPRQVDAATEAVAAVAGLSGPALLQVLGTDVTVRAAYAERVASGLGLRLLLVDDAVVADVGVGRAATLLDREALLGDRLLATGDHELLARLEARVVVSWGDPPATARATVTTTVDLPAPDEQLALWRAAAPGAAGDAPGTETDHDAVVRDLAQHYRLSARTISGVAGEWRALGGDAALLRRLTRERVRTGLGALAERVDVRATWTDLVLPDGQRALLGELVRQVRHRAQVYDAWGFGRQSARGQGITALFAGESGTGKTMAAEVLAADLGHDLYRIDLSAVVSKYIGETEKNLRAVFDAAESGGAVLLFDEADALFGKRSDVKDSHDRYANLEVAYLLQRMESYRGLALLTTNLRSNVDRAFLRRLRMVVQFPFPDEAAREQIWRSVFPAEAPLDGVDPAALARMQLSGGSIRTIAVSAAFAAAADGTAIRPEHLLRAAQVDCAKAERVLTVVETATLTGRPGSAP